MTNPKENMKKGSSKKTNLEVIDFLLIYVDYHNCP